VHQHRAQPDRAHLDQRGLRDRPLHRVAQLARLGRMVVRGHDLARSPSHRLDQFLPVDLERTAHLAHDVVLVPRDALVQVLHHRLPLPVILVHQPVDQVPRLQLHLLRRVRDHLVLEHPPHPVRVDQVQHPLDADGLVEEVVPPLGHPVQDIVHVAQVVLELAPHVALVRAELRLDRAHGLHVFLDQLAPRLGHVEILLRQPLRHPQRVGQLQPQSLLLVQRVQDVPLQRLEPARRPQPRALIRIGRSLGLARLPA